jgi:hypothetical protein
LSSLVCPHFRPSAERQSDNLLKKIENPLCPSLTGRTAAHSDTPCPVPLSHPSDAYGISFKVVCGGRVFLFDWQTGRGGLGREILHFRCRKTVLSDIQNSNEPGCAERCGLSAMRRHSSPRQGDRSTNPHFSRHLTEDAPATL